MFEQTIRLFKGDGAAIKRQRRTHPRVGIRCHIKIAPVGAGATGKPIDVWTRDLSRSGVGFVVSQQMAVGSRFVIRFARADNSAPLALVCTIKCCTQVAKGVYAIGAVFEGIDKTDSAAA
jgi:c-di-GMP-binding flagellar brake protein YcgR